MGFSSKQVSRDGLDWSKTLLQAPTLEIPKPTVSRRQQLQNIPVMEPLKCPRCQSTNTKFCYYNNYNKSQPRHFCKTCKRHWTKGGTLRNVPEGGGRKNKLLKALKISAKTATKSGLPPRKGDASNRVNPQTIIEAQCRKNTSETTSQPLISPPGPVLQQNLTVGNYHNSLVFGSNFHQNQPARLHLPYSSSNSETNPLSISTSLQTPNIYNYNTEESGEDSIVTSILPSTSNAVMDHLWQGWNTSNWNWDSLDTFAPTDLNMMPWDDSELKP